MTDLSDLRRSVIAQIQAGKLESMAIATALNEPEETIRHVIRVLAGEGWFKLDDAINNSLDIYDVRPGFSNL